jgi:glycosyltransferase involved in cell wall biosynthesis
MTLNPAGQHATLAHDWTAPTEPGWLFVLPWDLTAPGGVNAVVANLVAECRATGRFTPMLLVTSWADARLAEGLVDGLRTVRYRLRAPSEKVLRLRDLLAFWATLPRTLVTLTLFLRRNHVAVVNVHFAELAAYPLVLLRLLGLYRGRLLVSLHGLDLREAMAKRGLLRHWWSAILRRCDAVIACSAHLAAECRAAFPEVAPRLHVVHNAVDIASIERAASTEALPGELRSLRYVLSVARFEAKKGLDVLIRAFVRLTDLHPDLHLVVVGGTGPALAGLTELRAERGLEHRVHFYQNVPPQKVGAFYSRAEAFVLASRYEPFGIAALEAGVLKRPVIASDVGGLSEFLRHGHSAILVPPDDEVALADGMQLVLADPALARSLGRELHRDVHRRFSWSRAWREYTTIADMRQPPGA